MSRFHLLTGLRTASWLICRALLVALPIIIGLGLAIVLSIFNYVEYSKSSKRCQYIQAGECVIDSCCGWCYSTQTCLARDEFSRCSERPLDNEIFEPDDPDCAITISRLSILLWVLTGVSLVSSLAFSVGIGFLLFVANRD
jgi:hypothetical protein